MLDPELGRFDYVVAMDSLIHYDGADIARTIAALAARTTLVDRLHHRAAHVRAIGHARGGTLLSPRQTARRRFCRFRSTRIERRLATQPGLTDWRVGRASRVDSGFYISQAMEVVSS